MSKARSTGHCLLFQEDIKEKKCSFFFLKNWNISGRKVVNVETKGKARLMTFILLSEQTQNLDEKQL